MPPTKPDLRRGPRRSTKKALGLYFEPQLIANYCKACHSEGETMTEAIQKVMTDRVGAWKARRAEERAEKLAAATKPAPRTKRKASA